MRKKPRKQNGKPTKDDARLSKIRSTNLAASWTAPREVSVKSPILITGGAGFIGTNVADHFLSTGQPVLILDNLSRPGVEHNLAWLRGQHGDLLRFKQADIQDYSTLREVVGGVSRVFHFAAQVAVTTSLESPLNDFEVNARGTLNLLEALRELSEPPPLIFTSTNKVYGALDDVPLRSTESRYEPEHDTIRTHGFDELRPLDFHSPYGCSKGAAEQYVLDYARTFHLAAVVFRMSCIYGPHQFGTEDQGWIAHFLIHAMEGRPITVYGDGRQVRDILFIDDLVQAFVLAHEHVSSISGQAFNIGGGPGHTLSLLETVDLIAELQGERPIVGFDEWRPADQQFYVSDIRKFSAATGWKPTVDVRDGLERLYEWLRHSRTPRIPVVLPPEILTGHGGPNGSGSVARLRSNGTASPHGEARSKQIWKPAGASKTSLANKIIQFP